jgi:addiction module RelE/StbE family toxin
MKVRLTPQAKSDLDLIYQYLSERSAIGTRNVLGAIYSALELIAEHPHAGQKTDYQDIRTAVVQRYRYRIFYTVTVDAVEVLHVRHTARRPWLPQP